MRTAPLSIGLSVVTFVSVSSRLRPAWIGLDVSGVQYCDGVVMRTALTVISLVLLATGVLLRRVDAIMIGATALVVGTLGMSCRLALSFTESDSRHALG